VRSLWYGLERPIRRVVVSAESGSAFYMTPDQERSLWLAWAIAGRVAVEPERARTLAAKNIAKMHPIARGSSVARLDEWVELLAGPLETALAAYTARDYRGCELRQHNPFAGLLADDDRIAVLQAWRRLHPPPTNSE
jgi:hypothetical protein